MIARSDDAPDDFPHRRAVIYREVRVSKESDDGGGGGMYRRILEVLITTAVIGLVAIVMLLRDSVAILQTSQGFQQNQILDMKSDIRELQGRTFRGVPGYESGSDNAKQPAPAQ